MAANLDFSSDNAAGATPEVLSAVADANHGTAMAYGADDWTARLEAAFADLFETDIAVFPVATGTAANALALSALTPPHGAVYCHEFAHIAVDECGAPELYSGGAKLISLTGAHGRIGAGTLEGALDGAGWGVQHHVQPAAVSLTQLTEDGTVYTADQVAELCGIAKARGLAVHMDGARFANALASLGCTPADITWRAGVDVLSFGGTKNGALAAEAVVFFDRDKAQDFLYRRKRGGHLFSKMRFLSAQLLAMLEGGRWLDWAGHANAMAARLADGLTALDGITLAHPVDGNIVFARVPETLIDRLRDGGAVFHLWPYADGPTIRLVTSFATRADDVDALIGLAASRLSGA